MFGSTLSSNSDVDRMVMMAQIIIHKNWMETNISTFNVHLVSLIFLWKNDVKLDFLEWHKPTHFDTSATSRNWNKNKKSKSDFVEKLIFLQFSIDHLFRLLLTEMKKKEKPIELTVHTIVFIDTRNMRKSLLRNEEN